MQHTARHLPTQQRAAGRHICRASSHLRESYNQPLSLQTNLGAAAVAASLCLSTLAGAGPLQAAELTPAQEAKIIRMGPTADGSLRACGANPNCVSTASTNQLYAPAWRTRTTDPNTAAQALAQVVGELYPEANLVRSESYDYGEYRAYTVPGLFGKDVMEFLIKGEGVTDRNWEGDTPGAFVTYRSLAGDLKYVWPIQTPISDFGAQRSRLEALRARLGWNVIGCELIECYSY